MTISILGRSWRSALPIRKIPFIKTSISAGFPSPAQDFMEDDINLQEMLVPKPLSTFLIRVKGDSMMNAFIPDGALLVVDRSLKAGHGKIIVAVLNGEFTVKRLVKTARSWVLHPETHLTNPLCSRKKWTLKFGAW
jgi:DNA polymerase V